MTALHPTVPVTRDQERTALTQEERILKFFQFMGASYSAKPSLVHRMCFGTQVPIMSVRVWATPPALWVAGFLAFILTRPEE